MQSLRTSSSLILSRAFTASRGRGLALLSMMPLVPSTAVAFCEGGDKKQPEFFVKDSSGNIDWGKSVSRIPEASFWDDVAQVAGQNVQVAIDSGVPTQLSYGFVSGYCSGMALKKVGRVVASVVGLGFMTLQTLSYYGYVKVDHVAIKKDVEDFMDFNKDGKVDKQDGKIASAKLLEVLQYNMPAGGGFAAGFVGGLRSG